MKRRYFLKSGFGAAAAGAFIPVTFREQAGLPPGENQESHLKDSTATVGDFELYSGPNRVRSGICHGGIGTGGIELRKDGQFYNWSLFNNLPRGIAPPAVIKGHIPNGYDINRQDDYLRFIVRYQEKGQDPQMKLLRLIDHLEVPGSGIYDITYIFPWMTPVEDIRYKAKFPYTWLEFSDPDMPFKVSMEVFSPFIPHDVKNSTLPGVYFNFEIIPDKNADVDVTILGLQRNLVGYHTNEKYFITDISQDQDLTFISMTAKMDDRYPTAGKMGIGCTSPDASWYAGWAILHPFFQVALDNKNLPNIDDTNGTGNLKKPLPDWMPETSGRNVTDPDTGKKTAGGSEGEEALFSTLAASFNLLDKRPLKTTFLLTWYFPNQYRNANAFDLLEKGTENPVLDKCGHYYMNFFGSDLEVAKYLVKEQDNLGKATGKFLNDFYASTIDSFILDQINSHLNSMVTDSFLDKDGKYYIADDGGLLGARRTPRNGGLNPDVNIYASVLFASLYPEFYESALRGMVQRQRPSGEIGSNRSDWPSDMILMITRHYFWTGDRKFLEDMWPALNSSVGYCLNVLDQDGDQVPEIYAQNNGCTYDNLPMYGVAAYIVSLWICFAAFTDSLCRRPGR